MRYQLYYWSGIQGRGEFVRLALEDAGADYVNKSPITHKGVFAPPFLKAGKRVIAQTANILLFLDRKRDLRLHQQQLTIADWVSEVHEVHHPIASSLYYEEQRREAKRRAQIFRAERLPKFMGYFERNVDLKKPVSYVDLSLFQMIEGLRYAFPRTMARIESKYRKLSAVHDRVAARPRIALRLSPHDVEGRIEIQEADCGA